MSAIFARGLRPAGCLLGLALLAACGSSAPRQVPAAAAIGEPGIETVEPVSPETEEAYLQALDAMAAGDWPEAARRLELLIAEHPELPGPQVNLAIVYREGGRTAEAEAALARVLEISPGHAAANNELGVMARERGDFAGAEAAYRRAIAADPDYALAHYNLGVLLDLYLQRGDEALAQYVIYQELTGEPDPNVDFWVVDLRRRLGLPNEPVRLAQEDRQ